MRYIKFTTYLLAYFNGIVLMSIAVCCRASGNEGFQCQRCGKVFAYLYYRDKHLKYTRCVDQGDRKFPCHLCTR